MSAADDRLDPEEARLHAYADGQLPPEEMRAVEQRLAHDPDAAARVADWRRLNERLHALYDPTLGEPVPTRLLAAPAAQRWRLARVAAAAVLCLAIGFGVGMWWRGPAAPARVATIAGVAERAATAHAVYAPEVRHPVEVTADQEAHLVAWLSKRLGEPIKAPKLTADGYDLVGGRLLPGSDGPAAQFMYQEKAGGRITLYVKCLGKAARRETAFRYDSAGNVNVFTWVDERVAYALAAELPRERHLALAEAVYKQLNP